MWGTQKHSVLLAIVLGYAFICISLNGRTESPANYVLTPDVQSTNSAALHFGDVSLSKNEKAFLAAHPRIRVGIMNSWPPLNFVSQGKPQGIGVDYLMALNRRLGVTFLIEADSFKTNLKKIKEKKLDVIFDVTPKKERETYLAFTQPYLTIPHVLVTAKGRKPYLRNETVLTDETVALEKGFYNVTYFQTYFPNISILQFDSTGDALDAVSRGVADVYAGNRAVALYLIESQLLTNLEIQGRLRKPPVSLTIGVRKDWQVLAKLLERLLTTVTPEEKRYIYQRWGENSPPDEIAGLTEAEKEWLRQNPVLKMGFDEGWAPIEHINEKGELEGLSVEYLKRIEALLNVKFQPVPPKPWNEMIASAKNAQLDIISAITRTKDREQFLDFTRPYLSFPMVIVTKEDVTYIGSMAQLNGKKVGVVSAYASEEMLRRNYPRIHVMPSSDIREGLIHVVEGKTDAFVGSLSSVSWVIAREGISGLKVSGETPFSFDLCIGVKKDRALLRSSLQKALDAITEEDKAQIYRKWFNVTYQHRRDYSLIWKILLSTVLLVGLFVFWNRRLAVEVSRRKKSEAELKTAMERAESADRIKSAFLATMSHELRTPLNSIIGFTGILLQRLAGPLSDEQEKQLTIVRGASRHLLNLINDVLDISKIEAGQLELFNDPFSMDESIDEVSATVKTLATQKGIVLNVIHKSPLGTITGDQRRVNQVLLNLLNNAVKFTEQGSVTVSAQKKDGFIWVDVSDTGIGIKPDDLEKLFRPFQQIDTGINRMHEGTGLGLSICQRLVALWGGQISVTSTYTEGSTFSFTIPVKHVLDSGEHTKQE